MGGIPHPEREYAIIQRLCSQMPFDGVEYQATECYAAFNTILCWTLQRIRSNHHPLVELNSTLRQQDITDFCQLSSHQYDDGRLTDEDDPSDLLLDDLGPMKATDGQPLKAMEVLISLRNSVSHPNDLRVCPVNRRGFLIGFRFDCRKPAKVDMVRWPDDNTQFQLSLTRQGMTKIAQTLGSAYCAAFVSAGEAVQQAAANIGEK